MRRPIDGNDTKTYHALLAREGKTLDVSAMLTSFEEVDLCELWHRRLGHLSPKTLSRLVKEQMATGAEHPSGAAQPPRSAGARLYFGETNTLAIPCV
jgi:hypothetical protein